MKKILENGDNQMVFDFPILFFHRQLSREVNKIEFNSFVSICSLLLMVLHQINQ